MTTIIRVRRTRGVALILVLMITGVLGILMLQIGLTARQNVADTQRLQDRAEAWLKLHSRESVLEFSMLTNEWLVPEAAATDSLAGMWNFRGQVFSFDGAVYHLQDLSGLVPMPLPGQSVAPIRDVLVSLEVDPQRADSIVRQYQALVAGSAETPMLAGDGGNSRNPLQAFGELLNLTDMTRGEVSLLEQVATLYPVETFNPLTAPPAVLAARIPGLGGQSVVDLQREGRLTREVLVDLTGQGIDDFTSFYPGPAFRVEISVNHKGIRQARRSTLVVQPYSDEAIVLWSRQRLRDREGAL